MKRPGSSVLVTTFALAFGVADCSTPSTANDSGATTDAATVATSDSAATGTDGAATSTDCTTATAYADQVACATSAFLATLTDAQRASTVYAFSDSAARTRWSNLPGVARSGVQFKALTAASQSAAIAVARAALADDGFAEFTGIRAADDYLGTLGGGGGGGGSTYSSGNYYVAVFGAPSASGTWMLQIGGHHMAYNLTFQNGDVSPTPNHVGVEPKASFTINSESYSPLADDGAAMAAVFTGLDATQLAFAYLTGQRFDDVLLGPVEYGTGSIATVSFPSGTGRAGVLVSSLSATAQATVTAAIAKWVRDYPAAVSDPLMATYTSTDAYADTYVAWGGTQSSGPDVDVPGTYFRIDGPRVWIEVACQSGVVVQGVTHYHTIFRDKTKQYGATL